MPNDYLEVWRSLTEEQACERTFVDAHPAALCFTTDTNRLVFGGKPYFAERKVLATSIDGLAEERPLAAIKRDCGLFRVVGDEGDATGTLFQYLVNNGRTVVQTRISYGDNGFTMSVRYCPIDEDDHGTTFGPWKLLVTEEGGATIDSTLSETSPNPVQNAAITAGLGKKADVFNIGAYSEGDRLPFNVRHLSNCVIHNNDVMCHSVERWHDGKQYIIICSGHGANPEAMGGEWIHVIDAEEATVKNIYEYGSAPVWVLDSLLEGAFKRIRDLSDKTGIVEMGVGRKDASHSYRFEYEVTQGVGTLFKIHYDHGGVARSLQPRVICYAKGDATSIYIQPFRWGYIEESTGGNPPETFPFFYGQRTPPLSGMGTIYLFLAFADEPETYLAHDMEAYVNLEYTEALLPHDSPQRTLPYGGKFVINKQDIVFAMPDIKASGSQGGAWSRQNGSPIRFWAKAGARIASIEFSGGADYRPIAKVWDERTGTYEYSLSGYTVATGKGEYPLVEIEWKIENVTGPVTGSVGVRNVTTTTLPFSFNFINGDPFVERITILEQELENLKKKLH